MDLGLGWDCNLSYSLRSAVRIINLRFYHQIGYERTLLHAYMNKTQITHTCTCLSALCSHTRMPNAHCVAGEETENSTCASVYKMSTLEALVHPTGLYVRDKVLYVRSWSLIPSPYPPLEPCSSDCQTWREECAASTTRRYARACTHTRTHGLEAVASLKD